MDVDEVEVLRMFTQPGQFSLNICGCVYERKTFTKVPIQCEENPEGQNGFVVFESRSYRIALSETYAEDHGHQHSVCHEPWQNHVAPKVMQKAIFYDKHSLYENFLYEKSIVPVQCEENPEGQNGCIIFENISYRLPVLDAYV
ncbi:uncharacterized protein LOC111192861 [Tachysurus ichikawai]